MEITIGEIAKLVGGTVEESASQTCITSFASIAEAGPGDLTFFGNSRYLAALRTTRATAALVPLDFQEEIGPICIRVEKPSVAFAMIVKQFAPKPISFDVGIHPSASIAPDVILGEGVSIHANAVIEPGVVIGARTIIGANTYVGHESRIGDDCHIFPLVTVRERCYIGHRVAIHSGTVVGSDGFGYEQVGGRHVKIPQIGVVEIGDDVEIGANVTIDRARFGRTAIGEGTKIDNLVQIAHNVIIGKHCVIIAQVGISGSVRFGDYVIAAGQSGFAGHITVGDGSIIGGQSGVAKSIPPKTNMYGSPAVPERDHKRNLFYLHRLSEIFDRVKRLEQLLGASEKTSEKGE